MNFGGLQTGWTPNTPTVSTNQGMPGLMGNVLQQPTMPSLMNTSPGDWSQVAYNMAGRPTQGPYPSVPTPPMPAGVASGAQSSGGSSIGGTALGLLGSLAKNPSLLKTAANGISSLFGGSAIPASVAAQGADAAAAANAATGAYAADGAASVDVLPSVSGALEGGGDAAAAGGLMAGAEPALASVGTGAIAPAVDAAASDASSALAGGGLGAGAGAAAAGGLFALPLILAGTVASHDRNASQYATMLSNLNQGPSAPGYNGSMMEVVADIASGQTGEYPAAVLQKAQQLGLYQTAQNLGAYKGAVGTGGTAARSRNQQ